ncbi:hypothetical protein C0991_009886, partial [Blastosporella zonata]
MFAPKNSRPSISRKNQAQKDEPSIRKPLKRSVQREISSPPPVPLVIERSKIKASPGIEEFSPLPKPAATASISETTVVAEAFQSIADDKGRDLIVVLGTDGSLAGVSTSMDIVCHVIAAGLDPRTTLPICNQDGGMAGVCHLAEVFHEHLDIIQHKLKASEDIYNALLAAKAWLGTDALYSQMLESAEKLLDKHDTTNLATAISTQPPSLVVSSIYSVRRVAQLMKEKAVSACVVEDQTTDRTAPSLCSSKDLACYVAKYGS